MLSTLISRLSLSGNRGELLRTCGPAVPSLLSSGRLEQPNHEHRLQGQPLLSSEILVRFRHKGRITRSKRFNGHIDLYDRAEGKREPLYGAVERYKRLDWGMFVGTVMSRHNKKWKTWESTNWMREQHVSMDKESVLKLERMFTHDIKLPRYLPDDPYDKYNAMPYWKHRAGLVKNRKLIEKYGNTDHMFGRYYAHLRYRGKENILPEHHYMPPDYLKTIANNPQRVYKPDLEREAPSNEPAPYFQRKKLVRGKKRSGLNEMYQMRKQEKFLDKPLPLWNEAFHPTTHAR